MLNKIATIIGARPQFIKAAMVSRVFSNNDDLTEVIIHTGQHFDDNMSDVFFNELEIPKPDYNLGIGGGTHGQNTGQMIEKIEAVLMKEKPGWVVIYGDTDSTLAGVVAASKLHIPVAHVEAGLRSFNRRMPEEINRIVTDQLSTILFCPTETAVENLEREGFPHRLSNSTEQLIKNVGDVMYDAAIFYGAKADEKSRILVTLNLESKKYVIATIHRAENTDDAIRLEGIISALNEIAKEIPVILPLHPRTRKKLESLESQFNPDQQLSIKFIEPVGYLDMVMLEKNARVIITDSGGVQKEAFFHSVPCITVRDETEWVELVEIGANIVVGTNKVNIIKAFKNMQDKVIKPEQLYGNGNSSEKIMQALLDFNSYYNSAI